MSKHGGSDLNDFFEDQGLSKEVCATALKRVIAWQLDRCHPTYELDDGPLTDREIAAIRAASSATELPEECATQRLF